jgi:hypothetical protein
VQVGGALAVDHRGSGAFGAARQVADEAAATSTVHTNKLPRLQALRQAQLTVLGDPERVEARRRELRAELAMRGIAAEVAFCVSRCSVKRRGESDEVQRGFAP